MSKGHQDKVALITGSASGLGEAFAMRLAEDGAKIVTVDLKPAERALAHAKATGRDALGVRCDITAPDQIEALARQVQERFGGCDILVNNAGIYPPATTLDIDEPTFDRIYAVNVKAPVFLVARLAPAMIEAGGGVVINLGSWVARLGVAGGSVYASSKGAMETLTRAWSAEFGPSGVRVNAISPGVVHDPIPGGHPAAFMMNGTPAGAVGATEAIADAAVYLAGDGARFVHGTVIDVDGGRTGVAVVAP